MDRISFTPLRKVQVQSTDFHNTHICSTTALCGHLLHQISPKLVKKYGKYSQKII